MTPSHLASGLLAAGPPAVVALLGAALAVLLSAFERDERRGEALGVLLGEWRDLCLAAAAAVAVLATLALAGSLAGWAVGVEVPVWGQLGATAVGLAPTALAWWLVVPLRHGSRRSLGAARAVWAVALGVSLGLTWTVLDAAAQRAGARLVGPWLLAAAPQALIGYLALAPPEQRHDLTACWRVHRVGGLWLHVPPGTPAAVGRDLARRAHEALLAVEGRLETRCPGPLRVFLFADEAALRSARGALPGALGWATRRSVSLAMGRWEQIGGVLVHELAHVALRARLGRPTWPLLNEGLAEFLRREIHGLESAADAAGAPTVSTPLYLLAQPAAFEEPPPGQPTNWRHYPHALGLVAYLEETRGLGSVLALVAHDVIRAGRTPGQALDEAVQAVYGETLDALEARWRRATTGAASG